MGIVAACIYILGSTAWAFIFALASRRKPEIMAPLGAPTRAAVAVVLAVVVFAWPVAVPVALIAVAVEGRKAAP